METGFQRVFLTPGLLKPCLRLLLTLVCIAPTLGYAQSGDDQSDDDQADEELGKIITPDLERRQIKESMLDSENFELGAFFGLLTVEDFGSNPVTGFSFAYHATESFFLEAAYGESETQKTSYELLSGGVELLTEEERQLRYYNLSIGYAFLPGQVYIGKRWAFNTRIYLIGGAGNTEFASKEYFTYNLGAGLRFYASDWMALDLSMRNHAFTHELFGESKSINNLEARLGLSLYF